MQPLYNSIGVTYGATRRADPGITASIASYLGISHAGTFLDLACGIGNYACALEILGGRWHGIDVSIEMLEQAKSKSKSIVWQCADARALPYSSRSFDGVICILAIHHFPDLETPFAEVFRVLDRGKFVLLTAFPEQMRSYWLCRYFPQMMARSMEQMPSESRVVGALRQAGFAVQDVTPFHVTNMLQDHFLYCGKQRPRLYLNPAFRANMSSFATLCPPAELAQGLDSLRADIAEGRFRELAQRYCGAGGDYAYIVADKGRSEVTAL
jgi:SAM-dependent methyltransferase